MQDSKNTQRPPSTPRPATRQPERTQRTPEPQPQPQHSFVRPGAYVTNEQGIVLYPFC